MSRRHLRVVNGVIELLARLHGCSRQVRVGLCEVAEAGMTSRDNVKGYVDILAFLCTVELAAKPSGAGTAAWACRRHLGHRARQDSTHHRRMLRRACRVQQVRDDGT